jgi:hypothetical protein
MEFISDSKFASCQLVASVALIASLYVVGSPAKVKNQLGEYLSGGYDSLYDQGGMTRLASSSVVVLRMSELGSSEVVGSGVALLLGFSGSRSPSVLRESAGHEADLVCCAYASHPNICTLHILGKLIFLTVTQVYDAHPLAQVRTLHIRISVAFRNPVFSLSKALAEFSIQEAYLTTC